MVGTTENKITLQPISGEYLHRIEGRDREAGLYRCRPQVWRERHRRAEVAQGL